MRLGIDGRVLVHRRTGVARYLAGLLGQWPALRRQADRLEVYVDRAPAEPLAGEPDQVSCLSWPLPGGDPAWRQLRLAWHLRSKGPDVLFCPFYTIPLLASVPAVVTVHDVAFAAHPEWFGLRGRLAFRLCGPSVRRAERVLTDSRFSADEIQRCFGLESSRIEVVPAGVDARWSEPVEAEERAALRGWLGLDGPYLLHLGAVHLRRNVDLLVRAFALLPARFSAVTLVVAGPSIQPAPDLELLVRELGLESRVLRRHWVPEEHVRALLAETCGLAYLSSYEGFGLPALEAMAVGAPVAALELASLPEVLGGAAAWIKQPVPQAVADVLVELLGDGSYAAELQAAGRTRAARFGWRGAAERAFEILRDTASGHVGRRASSRAAR